MKKTNENIHFKNSQLLFFYDNYKVKSPKKVMLYMVITLGLYFIRWMYYLNKDLEIIDDNAPDSRRGAYILLIMPTIWYGIIYSLKETFSHIVIINAIITFEMIGWSLIIFLSLQYLYELCESFGKVTSSNGLTWYFFLYPGYIAIILVFFEFYLTLILVFFPMFSIPAMQAYINIKAEELTRKKRSHDFNSMTRAKPHEF